MRIARIQSGTKISHAVVEEGAFRLIDGDIFGQWKPSKKTVPADKAKLLAPVVPPQIIAIGANYRKHCAECHQPIPQAPIIFIKANTSLAGPGDTVLLPKIAPSEVDWEAELLIVIGKRAKHVSEDQAGEYILGYTCGNDVSARDCQIKLDKQWARGKSFDTFAPIGPWIATGLDGDKPANNSSEKMAGKLDIQLTLNGQVMQKSNSSDMIFSCRNLVSYLSRCMTLMPGTIIMTGTPSGVGMGRTPQMFLKAGDTMTVEIEGIGQLTNPVAAEE